MPTECFVPKDFRAGTRAIIRKANTLIADYQRQGYKLTLRQLYYQFVQRNWLVNKQTEYKRLGGNPQRRSSRRFGRLGCH